MILFLQHLILLITHYPIEYLNARPMNIVSFDDSLIFSEEL